MLGDNQSLIRVGGLRRGTLQEGILRTLDYCTGPLRVRVGMKSTFFGLCSGFRDMCVQQGEALCWGALKRPRLWRHCAALRGLPAQVALPQRVCVRQWEPLCLDAV